MSSQIETTLEIIFDVQADIAKLQAIITNIINHYPEFLKNNPNL